MNNINTFLTTKKIPKELLLILELLKIEQVDLLTINSPELFDDIDWNLFVKQGRHHRIYPLLYLKLKLLNENFIPSFVIDSLSKDYKRNTFQMLHLSAEMEYVSKLFTESVVPVLFLKGPVLAHDLYGDISLRTSSDLDILVPLNELGKAEQLLRKCGYEKDEYIQTVLGDWKWRHHHASYFHPVKKTKVEVHWRLNPGPGLEPEFKDLWERKRRSELTCYPVYLLGKEDLFLFLVTHGSRHGWSRLRWLVDVQQLIKQEVSWEKIYMLLKQYQHLHVGGQALILASQLLRSKLNVNMNRIIKSSQSRRLAQEAIFYLETMINLHTDPLPKEVANYHKRHLFALMSNKQKVYFTLSFLYPYPEDAATLPLPTRLHLLYFPLRPFLWVWRKARKQALS